MFQMMSVKITMDPIITIFSDDVFPVRCFDNTLSPHFENMIMLQYMITSYTVSPPAVDNTQVGCVEAKRRPGSSWVADVASWVEQPINGL